MRHDGGEGLHLLQEGVAAASAIVVHVISAIADKHAVRVHAGARVARDLRGGGQRRGDVLHGEVAEQRDDLRIGAIGRRRGDNVRPGGAAVGGNGVEESRARRSVELRHVHCTCRVAAEIRRVDGAGAGAAVGQRRCRHARGAPSDERRTRRGFARPPADG